MKSAANEEYKCFLPSESNETPIDEEGPGEPAEALLAPIFVAKNGKPQCSYRLEVSILYIHIPNYKHCFL